MAEMDQLQMQIEMIKTQAEAQKNMFRQMYASDPAMVEHLCSQLDQTTEMQIQMLTQVMGATGPDGTVDPQAQARMVLDHLGYDEEQMSQLLGGEDDETLTEEVMGEIEPSEFGYGDIVNVISSLARLEERQPEPADAEGMRRFEVLLTGIISTLNDHLLDGLDVEPRTPDNEAMVRSILEDYWGVEDRDGLLGTIHYLAMGGHTQSYMDALNVIAASGSASDLHTEDMDEEDIAISDARFEFAKAYAGQYGPEMIRGWDLGRAANLTRWGYFVGYLTEEEAWDLLDQIADNCIRFFESWTSYAQSYIFGSMYWKCPYGPEECYGNAAGLLLSVEELLTEGAWKDAPWASGRA